MYYVYAEVVSDSADQLSASCSGRYHGLCMHVCKYAEAVEGNPLGVCKNVCVCVCVGGGVMFCMHA